MDSNSQIDPIFVREKGVLNYYLPGSRSTLWRKVRSGLFPAPIKVLGITAWLKSDLDLWAAEVAGGQDGR
jgi:predicted DNA-binding transcriptional regulator AlpA